MASPVESVNKALSHIGDTSFIEDFSDPQNERERLANLHYESTRDEVLQDFPWPFARTFVALAVVTGDVPGWTFKYRYPTDCLMAKLVTDDGGYRLPAQFWFDRNFWGNVAFPIPRFSYEVQADPDDEGARIILCDVEDAYLWYVKRIENLNQWTALARAALEWRLAMKFATGLKADDNEFIRAKQMYDWTLSQAQAHSFNEQRPDDQPQSPAIQARL
jgi:hypothetical protein